MDAKSENRQRNQELRTVEREMRCRIQCQASLLGSNQLQIDFKGGSRGAHQPPDLREMSKSLSMA